MARALVRLSVTLAAGAAAVSESADDAAALLQVGAAVERTDACQCLNWKDVYANHGVECGRGKELDFAGGYRMKPFVGEEFCTRFYEKVEGNFCTNLAFGTPKTDQWCYVSAECEHNIGGEVGSLKWKQCEPGTDLMLGKMTPEEVHDVAVKENKDAGLVLKMAYPIHEPSLKWPTVLQCLSNSSFADPGCKELQAVQDAGAPTIFDSMDGHPPFGVVVGKKAYESHFSSWFFKTITTGGDLWASPGKMNEYECVADCDA